MKLYELFEDAESWARANQTLAANKKRAVLGKGLETTAYTKGRDDRVYKLGQSQDAGSAFLAALAKSPEMQQNPFLPRVRSTKTRNGVQVSVVERLQPVSSVDTTRDAVALYAMVFGKKAADKIELDKRVAEHINVRNIIDVIAENIFFYMGWGETAGSHYKIKNPQLLQAMTFVNQAKHGARAQGIRASVDQGAAMNLMIRKTAEGIQLVINDPITSQTSSNDRDDYEQTKKGKIKEHPWGEYIRKQY